MAAFASKKELVLFLIGKQQNAYTTTGGNLSRKELEKFLDSLQESSYFHLPFSRPQHKQSEGI